MPDDEAPEIEPINVIHHRVLTVDRWPERTSFPDEWLRSAAHLHGATVEGDVVTFTVFNGGAVYTLTDERDSSGKRIAVLDDRKVTRRKV